MAGTATPRKRAPRKPTAVKSSEGLTEAQLSELATAREEIDALTPLDENGQIRPVVIGKRGRPGADMVHFLTCEGVDYYLPKNPNPALGLRYLRQAQDPAVGLQRATLNLTVSLLGKEALDALAESPETTPEDMADVFFIIQKVAFDSMADMTKKDGAAGN